MSFLLSLFRGGDHSCSTSRKRIRADEDADEIEEARISKPALLESADGASSREGEEASAKQGRIGEAADVAASRAAVTETTAEADAAKAERIEQDRMQLDCRVACVLLQSRRTMKTVELIRAIIVNSVESSLYSGTHRTQVRALRAALLTDATRRQSLLDPNFQDVDGKTLVMHVIDLCAKAWKMGKLSYMDSPWMRTQLKKLLARANVRLKDGKGENSLGYLAKKIQVNNANDLVWWLASKLVALASAAGVLEARDSSGLTAFLRWCQTVDKPHVLQLLVDAGCDVTASDKAGNNGIHELVIRSKHATLEALSTAKRSFVVQPWCVPNNLRLTPLDLADSHLTKLLLPAHKVWTTSVAQLLRDQINFVLNGGKDVARICVEYLDGSGPPFIVTVEDDEESSSESSVSPLTALELSDAEEFDLELMYVQAPDGEEEKGEQEGQNDEHAPAAMEEEEEAVVEEDQPESGEEGQVAASPALSIVQTPDSSGSAASSEPDSSWNDEEA